MNLYDDEGNIVFERELEEDEIIEQLLNAIPETPTVEPLMPMVPAGTPYRLPDRLPVGKPRGGGAIKRKKERARAERAARKDITLKRVHARRK